MAVSSVCLIRWLMVVGKARLCARSSTLLTFDN